jgi:branched-chain amino acid transport system substrate-binding protein
MKLNRAARLLAFGAAQNIYCNAADLREADRSRELQDAALTIGANVAMTNQATIGEEITRVVDMWTVEVANAGGIQLGDAAYPVEVSILDNENDIDLATEYAQTLIDEGVLAALGPSWSSRAIPAGQVANEGNTTMISAASTNPATTLDRPYVFRASFLDSFQGPMVAKFISEQYGYTKAAIVHECEDAYSAGLAGYFKDAWEEKYGTVVSNLCVDATLDEDELDDAIGSTAAQVALTDAEFLFLPTYGEVGVDMIQAVRDQPAWGTAPASSRTEVGPSGRLIVGGDGSIGDAQLLAECGDDCEGVIAVKVFDAGSEDEATVKFVTDFGALYDGRIPNDTEALTYDCLNLMKNAIENCGIMTGDLATDRDCINTAMAGTIAFPGVAGNVTFDENGDPQKCVNFAQVVGGEQETFSQLCPEA